MSKDRDLAGSSGSSNSFFKLMGFVKRKPPLPEGWIVKQSNTYPDRVYFFNMRTGATTWSAPGFSSSDTGSQKSLSTSSETSDQPGRSKSGRTKAAHTAPSPDLSSGMTLNNTRQPPIPPLPGKGQIPVARNPPRKARAESLCELSQKASGQTGRPLSKRDDRINDQRFKDSRLDCVNKRRNSDGKTSMVAPSPPWGIPLKGSHPAGTLTPESLTPRSLPSRNGPSDASSVSSLSSKLGSPAASKPPPPMKRKKRSRESSASSDNQSTTLKTKSKQLKATVGQKPQAETFLKKEAPKQSASIHKSKDCTKTAVIQPQVPLVADKSDLRLQIERSRRLKALPQQPMPDDPDSNPVSKLPSTPAPPSVLPVTNQADKLEPESSTDSASRERSSKSQKTSRANWRRKEFKASAKDGKTKTSPVSRPNSDVGATSVSGNRDVLDPISFGLFNKDPGIDSFPAVQEDDESSQMEIDDVDASESCSISNMGLHVVLDTNILMHDLPFLREFLDQRIKGLGRPILVIPWIVMQELDALKIGSSKGDQAWNAVQFLHKCFMSEHPRVKGEPLRKVSDEADFEITCNDDWILQCCLQFQKKAGKDLVVLLSNDKHLCSKAVVSSIKAFCIETLLCGLDALAGILQHRPPLPPEPSETSGLQNYDPPLTQTHRPTTPSLTEPPISPSEERELCDELVCQVKEALLLGLTVVLETEMKEAYDQLWTEIVVVKPPWSFQDAVQCIEKHWMAVFGFFLNKEDNRHFLQIKELTSAMHLPLASVKRLVNSSVYLCRRLRQHSRYDGALEQPILRLGELKKRCLSPTPGKTIRNQISSSEELTLSEAKQSGAAQIVPVVFETVWLKILQLSALIFEGLGIPHDLETDKMAVIPSELECHACLNILCPLLQEMIEAIERVTEMPDSCIEDSRMPFERLLQIIQVFLREFVANERERFAHLTTFTFQKFVLVFSNRQLLRNGVIQLTSALSRLAQCQGVSS